LIKSYILGVLNFSRIKLVKSIIPFISPIIYLKTFPVTRNLPILPNWLWICKYISKLFLLEVIVILGLSSLFKDVLPIESRPIYPSPSNKPAK